MVDVDGDVGVTELEGSGKLGEVLAGWVGAAATGDDDLSTLSISVNMIAIS